MHPHTGVRKPLDGRRDIHRIAPQPVKLGHGKDIARFHAVSQFDETGTAFGGRTWFPAWREAVEDGSQGEVAGCHVAKDK